MELDIRKLGYFVEVVKSRSFTTAARNLYVSQPMLSKVIQQMEAELGTKLIDRSSRRFELTGDGVQFYDRAVRLLDEYRGLLHLFDDSQRLMCGEVTISIPAVILSLYFPKFLMEFRNQYPGIRINIFEEGSKAALQSVLTDNANIGIVMLPVTAQGLEISHLTEDRGALVVSRDHPLASRENVHLSELRQEAFIIFNRRFVLNEMILNACDSEGFTPNVIYQSSLDSFIISMVALNQGISILPRPLLSTYRLDEIRTIALDPVIPWRIAMIVKQDRYHSHAVREMTRAIKAYFCYRA